MAWGMAAVAGASLVGGMMAADAAGNAADTQAGAARDAAGMSSRATRESIDEQRRQYNQNRQDMAPWRNAGGQAINQLNYLLGLGSPGDVVNKEQFRTGTKHVLVPVTADNFNEQGYWEANPDLVTNGWADTARQHYYVHGNHENRQQYVDQGIYDEDAYKAAVEAAKQGASQPGSNYGSLLKNFTLADFQADPGYQFRVQQGEQGINRALASRGMYDSGAALKDLDRFNSGIASDEFGNAYNRDASNKNRIANFLQSVAGIGQSAANTTANLGSATAAGIGNALTNGAALSGNYLTSGANASAAGMVGGANALNGGLTGAYNAYQNNQLISRLFPSSGTPSSSSGYTGQDYFSKPANPTVGTWGE